MKFDSPAEVYSRALPDGHQFDPFDEQSRDDHTAALDAVARVHPMTSWPNRRGGFSDEDINRCMELLARDCGDKYIQVAKQLLTKKQVANWNYRRSRHVETENAKTGRFRQRLINAGEHPDDAAEALRWPKKSKSQR